ncbi:hypothetical protein JCM17380_48410 [Desulfosporosinus burensis]
MAFPNKKRPLIIVLGHKSWLWIASLVGLAVIMGIIGIKSTTAEPKAYFSSQVDVLVNSPAEGTGIKFQVETVKQSDSGENYFVNYRLKREQFRQETKAMLSELLNSSVEKSKAQAQEKWLELSTKIQREGEIENLLKIKGFQDAVVDVFQDSVTVIVYAQILTTNEVNLIQEIVVRVTNVRLDKITITAKNS